jgi:hypothetical protein
MGVLFFFVAEIGSYPLDREARRAIGRHRVQDAAIATLLAALSRHKAATPSGLARIFELGLLEKGFGGLEEDQRYGPSCRALPGLRGELIRFARREAPELEAVLRNSLPESPRTIR